MPHPYLILDLMKIRKVEKWEQSQMHGAREALTAAYVRGLEAYEWASRVLTNWGCQVLAKERDKKDSASTDMLSTCANQVSALSLSLPIWLHTCQFRLPSQEVMGTDKRTDYSESWTLV